jgi:hypothetical protein
LKVVHFLLLFPSIFSWMFFCVEFACLGFVCGFAESYYFVQLVVLKSILLAFVSVLIEVSAFW